MQLNLLSTNIMQLFTHAIPNEILMILSQKIHPRLYQALHTQEKCIIIPPMSCITSNFFNIPQPRIPELK